MEVTLTSKCQFTLPAKVRDHLHVHAGDKLDIRIKDDGEVVLRAKTGDWRKLIGILNRVAGTPVTDQQITEAGEAGLVDNDLAREKRLKPRRRL